MPVYHLPIEDLTDFVEELEHSRVEKIQLVHNHPINIGMLVVVTERVSVGITWTEGSETR
jgi:hypothetical protein